MNRKIFPTIKTSKDVTTTLPPPRIKIPKHRKGEAASSTLRENYICRFGIPSIARVSRLAIHTGVGAREGGAYRASFKLRAKANCRLISVQKAFRVRRFASLFTLTVFKNTFR